MMTVSNVINGTGKVSDQTRASVRQAIRNTGYVPNYEARRLASGGCSRIALLYSDQQTPFAAKQILDLQNRPTAIVASNDDMASGVVWVAQQRRLELPGDLSVAGFDDTPTALKSWPPLTVIRQPIDRMVEHGVSLLLDSVRTPTMSVPQDVVFDYTLVERASTSAVGARP